MQYLIAILEQKLSGKVMGMSAVKKIYSGLKFLYQKASYLGTNESILVYNIAWV